MFENQIFFHESCNCFTKGILEILSPHKLKITMKSVKFFENLILNSLFCVQTNSANEWIHFEMFKHDTYRLRVSQMNKSCWFLFSLLSFWSLFHLYCFWIKKGLKVLPYIDLLKNVIAYISLHLLTFVYIFDAAIIA